MSTNETATTAGFPLASILTIIFVLAKMSGAVTWSWWWVFSPIWLPALLGLGIAALAAAFVILVAIFAAIIG